MERSIYLRVGVLHIYLSFVFELNTLNLVVYSTGKSHFWAVNSVKIWSLGFLIYQFLFGLSALSLQKRIYLDVSLFLSLDRPFPLALCSSSPFHELQGKYLLSSGDQWYRLTCWKFLHLICSVCNFDEMLKESPRLEILPRKGGGGREGDPFIRIRPYFRQTDRLTGQSDT